MSIRTPVIQSGPVVAGMLVLMVSAGSLLSGCSRLTGGLGEGLIQRWNKVDMSERIDDIPPIKVETLSERYMLVMRAPNSGWTIAIDKDERMSGGMRVYITVRRPDPAFLYPQAIVDKRVLSEIHTDAALEIHARLLDANEKTSGRGYVVLDAVDGFEE